jgi:hypothetical protein
MAMRSRVLASLAVLAAAACTVLDARAADAPVIEAVLDAATGVTLWQRSSPSASANLRPGQAIIVRGHDFGPGPVTAATPGLGPPAGGVPPGDGTTSVLPSASEPADRELSKLLFGNVRAMERNLSSYRARINLDSAASAVLSRILGQTLDYFVEDYNATPDTWVADIATWTNDEINVTVPITAYEGPIEIVRIPLTKETVSDIRTGAPLRYRDPNTARVIEAQHRYAFVDGWRIRRTGAAVLVSKYFTAGIKNEAQGLFGSLSPVQDTDKFMIAGVNPQSMMG